MKQFLLLIVLAPSLCLAQVPRVKWFYDVNDASFGMAASADVDGDGKLEIVFSNYRNDSSIYMLNGEDGSLLWKFNSGGCNDVAPLIYDVDQDGDKEVVVPGSCNPTTYCLDADSGFVEWSTPTRGSDSPPTIGDIDNDGKLEILHGQFGGWVVCINGEDGSKSWDLKVDTNSWIQTAPAMLDVDGNGQLDFVVGNWSFGTDHRVFAYRGDNQQLIWSDTMPSDYMYHGTAFGDIDQDGKPELTIGDYNGNLFCYNAEDGSMAWQSTVPSAGYAGAPSSLADLDNDGDLDVVYFQGSTCIALTSTGGQLWAYSIPGLGQAFRGAAIADINGDAVLDVTFGTSTGFVYSLDGMNGSLIRWFDLQTHFGAQSFDINHGPIVADFDNDDTLDVFVVGGHAEFPAIQNNYGRAYALVWGKGNGPEWRMFRRDYRRSACICNDSLLSGVNPTESIIENDVVFPNPGNGKLNLRFSLKQSSKYNTTLLNHQGQVLFQETELQGEPGVNAHEIDLNKYNVSSGVYVIKLQGDGFLQTYKYIRAN